jgi:hypothetical protein
VDKLAAEEAAEVRAGPEWGAGQDRPRVRMKMKRTMMRMKTTNKRRSRNLMRRKILDPKEEDKEAPAEAEGRDQATIPRAARAEASRDPSIRAHRIEEGHPSMRDMARVLTEQV